MLFRDRIQPVHIHRLAGQVDRDDPFGMRRDRGFDLVQIDVARDRVNVSEHRRRTDFEYYVRGRDPRNRRGDDLVTRTDARDAQRNLHRAGAGIEGAHRTPAEIGGKLFLEFLYFGTAGDPTGAQHIADRGDGCFVDGGSGKRKEGSIHSGPRYDDDTQNDDSHPCQFGGAERLTK